MTATASVAAGRVTVFGIRHHGPGSARALDRALVSLRPDLILVEGPPEADELVGLAGRMEPPVALLAYATGAAEQTASYWPFATFSPEWRALCYANEHGVPLRFCDLPAANSMAMRAAKQTPAESTEVPQAESGSGSGLADRGPEGYELDEPGPAEHGRTDPIGALASAAGYEDAETWWEDVIEHRRDGDPFAAVAEAMAAVRADHQGAPEDLVREAYMRRTLRAALTEGYQRIAVVCGAWHVPALSGQLPPAARDAALLKGLPKIAVTLTWVPWTHGRLASWTGYGAGVSAPGWYHHLFSSPDQPVERWLVRVAGELRGEDLPVSSAHVIEAVRLADTLAVLRGRPQPGLAEVTEATRSVICDGDEVRLALIQERLVVGELLGAVPDDTPSVPLARDLAAEQKRLRFPAQALIKDQDLDLRKPMDLARSQLLHRLRLLGVSWGEPADKRGKGTFWESWRLQWRPELAVELVTASRYGTTVVSAATARTIESASRADLPELTTLLEACLLAELPEAQPRVLAALDDRAALDSDLAHLMDAVPALARTLRYGDVRGTSDDALSGVLTGLVARIQLGLPQAVTGLDEDAAKQLCHRLDATHEAITMLGERLPLRSEWLETLSNLADRSELPGLLAGRLLRLLRDAHVLDADAVELRLARALTVGVPAPDQAAFVEGFVSGGGLLLVHDEQLLSLVDRWLSGLAGDTFTAVVPLLRRTFAAFAGPERRAVGERVRQLGAAPVDRNATGEEQWDPALVEMIVPTLQLLLQGERPQEVNA